MIAMRSLAAVLLLLTIVPVVEAEPMAVLLGAHREGWIEVLGLDSFSPIARFQVGRKADSVAASPDGRILYITQKLSSDPNGCCALYAVDLIHRSMTFMIEPATRAVVSPSGDRVFTQRGNVGVEVFDGRTLKKLPTLKSRASYSLHPSPDGRWLYGVTNSGDILTRNTQEGPALHIFDLQRNERVRQLSLPYPAIDGAWIDNIFYLVGFDGEQGHLWRVTADLTALDRGQAFPLPGLTRDRRDLIPLAAFASGAHLFIYERFGMKIDRRDGGKEVSGGIFEVDPAKAQVVRRLAPELHFARLVAAPDGRALYGIDVESSAWKFPKIVKLDVGSGRVEVMENLPADVWSLGVATIPSELLSSTAITISAR